MWEMYPDIKPSPGEEKQFYNSIRDHYWAPPGGGGSLLPKYMPFPTSEMPRLGYEGGTTALRAAEAQRRDQLLAELDELEAIGSGTTPAYRAGVGGPPWRE
jgi:hypothetical protein